MRVKKSLSFNSIKKSDAFLKWYKECNIKSKDVSVLKKLYSEFQYKEWLKTNPIKVYSEQKIKALDEKITTSIINELKHTSSIDINEYMVEHKWQEIQEFHKNYKTTLEEVKEVKDLMWKPQGRSDFRRIDPELLLTTDNADIQHTDFWGRTTYRQKVVNNKFLKHWNILRVFISSSRHDGAIGRQLHYLVRDKNTQTYLGIICIQSALRNIKPRNDELFGKRIDEVKLAKLHQIKALITNAPDEESKTALRKKHESFILKFENEKSKLHKESRKTYNKVFGAGATARQLHMANGQTIMGTQPFSRTFNGGKLLALLCISDQVQKDWQTRFGDKLVTVETTSLYGEKDQTQYDGLKPFWINLGEKTSGQTVIKPSNKLYNEIGIWMKRRYPQEYFRHLREKNINGQNAVRETKNQLISKTYQRLRIKNHVDIFTNHQRGVYLSKLYSNAEHFLQYKIDEKDLIPQKFDTSVNELTNFWKFGYEGDTKLSKNQKLIEIANNKMRHSNKNSPAKVRLQYLINKAKEKGAPHMIEHLPTDWYGQMQNLSLAESKKQYLDQIGR